MQVALEAAETEQVRVPDRATGAFGMHDLVDLLLRRWRLVAAMAGAMLVLAVIYLALQVPVYRATVELLVDPQVLQVVGRDIARPDTSASIDFANVDSQALVMVSSGVLRQVVATLGLDQDGARPGLLARLTGVGVSSLTPDQRLAQTLDWLKRSIVIQRVDNSLVFRATVSNPDPQRAADIANTLAMIYLRQGNDGRRNVVKRATDSIIGQISDLRTQLNQAEVAVERFRTQNGLVSTGETGLVVTQQLRDLYTQINQASAEVARQAARRDQLARIGANSLLTDTIPEALASPTVAALRAQYAQTAREAASLAQSLGSQHPQLVQIRAQLNEISGLLGLELGRIRSSIQGTYNQSQANLANLQARARELTQTQQTSSAAEIRLRQLESEAEAIRSVYSASLGRTKELEQQQKIETNNSRVLSDAVPPATASKPPAVLVLAAALLFGLCGGLGLAYLVEALPKRSPRREPMTPDTAARLLDVGTLVTLPRDTRPAAAVLGPVADAVRGLRGAGQPCVVAVLDLSSSRHLPAIAETLGDALVAQGEIVLVCADAQGIDVKRIAPVEEPVLRPVQLRPFPGRYGQSRLVEAEPEETPAPHSKRANFVLTLPRDAADLSWSGLAAQAVVLVVDAEATTPQGLTELASQIEGQGARIAALLAVQPGRNESRRSRIWSRLR